MVNSTNTLILTALLQKLEQPYTIDGSDLIIEPTSSPFGEILPGEWVHQEDGPTLNLVDLDTFDTVEWMAKIIASITKEV